MKARVLVIFLIILLCSSVVYADNIKIDVEGDLVEGIRRESQYYISLRDLANVKNLDYDLEEDKIFIYGIGGNNVGFSLEDEGVIKLGRDLYLDIDYMNLKIHESNYEIVNGIVKLCFKEKVKNKEDVEEFEYDKNAMGGIDIVGNFGGSFMDYGITSPIDMPKIDGCSDEYDDYYYYGGIAAGVDPALLKSIAAHESGGKIPKDNINRDKNGVQTSYDVGIMQINSGGFAGLGVHGKDAINELRTNSLMNIWASTEILKGKYSFIQSIAGERRCNRDVNEDSLSLLWGYASMTSLGYKYGSEIHDIYMGVTRLTDYADNEDNSNRFTFNLFTNVVYANSMTIQMTKVITKPDKMSYNEFASLVEDLSAGNIKPNRYELDEEMREKYRDIFSDESFATGVYGERRDYDILSDFSLYSKVTKAVKIINKVVAILVYLWTFYIVIIWGLWALGRLGLSHIGLLLGNISGGVIDVLEEDSLRKLVRITIVDIIILSMVISGTFIKIVEKILINILIFFK